MGAERMVRRCEGYTSGDTGCLRRSSIASHANSGAIPYGEMAEWSMAVVLKK